MKLTHWCRQRIYTKVGRKKIMCISFFFFFFFILHLFLVSSPVLVVAGISKELQLKCCQQDIMLPGVWGLDYEPLFVVPILPSWKPIFLRWVFGLALRSLAAWGCGPEQGCFSSFPSSFWVSQNFNSRSQMLLNGLMFRGGVNHVLSGKWVPLASMMAAKPH